MHRHSLSSSELIQDDYVVIFLERLSYSVNWWWVVTYSGPTLYIHMSVAAISVKSIDSPCLTEGSSPIDIR